MKLVAPIRHLPRMRCRCYGPEGLSYNISASLGGSYGFEVEDFITAVVYEARDSGDVVVGEWIWDGTDWMSLEEPVAAELLQKAANPVPLKPKAKAKPKAKPPEPAIDPQVWANAEAYVKEYDKRWKSVEKGFKKATK
jgi:hypothetical protein